MSRVHFSAWMGLLLNLMITIAMWFFNLMAGESYFEMSPSERDLYNVSGVLKFVFLFAFLAQAASLFILFKYRKSAFVVAGIASFVMMPLSLVFFGGFTRTANDLDYQSTAVFPLQSIDELEEWLNFRTAPRVITGLFCLFGALVLFVLGSGMAAFALLTGVFSIFMAWKLSRQPLVGVKGNNIVFTPTFLAKTYIAPAENVELVDNNDKKFTLRLKSESGCRDITLLKSQIAGDNYQPVLETILEKIQPVSAQQS